MDIKKSGGGKLCIRPRLRIMRGKEIALGPGRVELLEFINQTGSLRAAAKRMGISYMRAWKLVKYTNRSFDDLVVEITRGGKTGGGAKLTSAGRAAVNLYRRMENSCLNIVKKDWNALRKLLRD